MNEHPHLVDPPGFTGSVPIAAGVCAAFLWSAQGGRFPAPGWAAVFLFLAVEHDVRCQRIPNWLTAGGLAAALGRAAVTAGFSGLGYALAGAGVALAALLVPFALRGIGAGDVKAIMALGALWGPERVLPVLCWALIAGGALAIVRLIARGELGDLCVRWARSAWLTLSSHKLVYFGPSAGSAAASGMPFAVALGLGASFCQLWGAPWA